MCELKYSPLRSESTKFIFQQFFDAHVNLILFGFVFHCGNKEFHSFSLPFRRPFPLAVACSFLILSDNASRNKTRITWATERSSTAAMRASASLRSGARRNPVFADNFLPPGRPIADICNTIFALIDKGLGSNYVKHIRAEILNEAGRPMDCSKVRRAHEAGLKAAGGLRHIRVHDLRGTYAPWGVSAGAPVYHVSKSLGHSETSTTERLYANLAPGAARELPNILERFVRNATVQNANQVRTE